jgi:hypothetical protein
VSERVGEEVPRYGFDRPLRRLLPWLRWRGELDNSVRVCYCQRCDRAILLDWQGLGLRGMTREERRFVRAHQRCIR